MHAHPMSWSAARGWQADNGGLPSSADLVFYFGTREALADGARYHDLRTLFPGAHVLGCSTGGQIRDNDVDDELAAVAMTFERTPLRLAVAPAEEPAHSYESGAAIGKALAGEDLAGVFVLSDGLHVNGSELVRGITSEVGSGTSITGGLAGDGANFQTTLVGGDCPPKSHLVAAVGFYGAAVKIGHGSAGGWDEFGPRRRITRSQGNVLFELDGEPALDLYKRYLGDEAKDLPGSALLFPLRIRDPQNPSHELVRTVLAVDHGSGSMTFAGDMPQGWATQLMRGTFDRLAAGAADAARQARAALDASFNENGLALLVSCIGRRLLMGQRTTEEVEAAGGEFAARVPRLGFYSYGEISPHGVNGVCQLHNQTMTVTVISEAA